MKVKTPHPPTPGKIIGTAVNQDLLQMFQICVVNCVGWLTRYVFKEGVPWHELRFF